MPGWGCNVSYLWALTTKRELIMRHSCTVLSHRFKLKKMLHSKYLFQAHSVCRIALRTSLLWSMQRISRFRCKRNILELPYGWERADEQVYSHLFHLIWKHKDLYANIKRMSEGFHQLKVIQKILGKRQTGFLIQ